jgi:hypothetical protein
MYKFYFDRKISRDETEAQKGGFYLNWLLNKWDVNVYCIQLVRDCENSGWLSTE